MTALEIDNQVPVAAYCRQAELPADRAAGHRQPWTGSQRGQKGWVDTPGSLGQETKQLKGQRALGKDASKVGRRQRSHKRGGVAWLCSLL